jgi:uncharacterized protein YutE (UPF0331/DUF86 family)
MDTNSRKFCNFHYAAGLFKGKVENHSSIESKFYYLKTIMQKETVIDAALKMIEALNDLLEDVDVKVIELPGDCPQFPRFYDDAMKIFFCLYRRVCVYIDHIYSLSKEKNPQQYDGIIKILGELSYYSKQYMLHYSKHKDLHLKQM